MSSRKLDYLDVSPCLDTIQETERRISKGRSRRYPRDDIYTPNRDQKSFRGALLQRMLGYKAWTFDDVSALARDLFRELGSPLALEAERLLSEGDYLAVMKMTVDPRKYSSREEYLIDAQVVSFLRKLEVKLPGLDPKAAAVQKFLESEVQCSSANERLRRSRRISSGSPVSGAVFHYAREFIRDTIGLRPNAEEWLSRSRFGPGSTTANRGTAITEYDKLLTCPDSTHEIRDVALAVIASSPCWTESRNADSSGNLLGLVPGNEFFSVPKTALTDRPCCKEPTINSFLQLGLGGIIRKRLKRAGIDLDNQVPNQQLAYLGSVDNSLATIDLQSASDTMCRELVEELLPPEWFSMLDLCRSKVGLVDGKWIRYEKFSSMGNGFTFELESLIFASLVHAVATEAGVVLLPGVNCQVYGDDIICPSTIAPRVIEVLAFCGFSTNVQKTYIEGPFRESCGKDYFNGQLVRPLFLTKVPTDVGEVYALANGFHRASHDLSDSDYLSGLYRRLALHVEKRLPRDLQRVRVPFGGPEDGGLFGDPDPLTSGSLNRGWEGSWFYRLRRVPVKRYWQDPSAAYAAMLYRIRNPWVPIPMEIRDPLDAGFSYCRLQERITLTPMTCQSWVSKPS